MSSCKLGVNAHAGKRTDSQKVVGAIKQSSLLGDDSCCPPITGWK
jgi:hypothetical protein